MGTMTTILYPLFPCTPGRALPLDLIRKNRSGSHDNNLMYTIIFMREREGGGGVKVRVCVLLIKTFLQVLIIPKC